MEYAIAYLVGVIVWGIVWGIAARAIALNKGYSYEGVKWFWLGFFFSFIAVIVAATKPSYQPATSAQPTKSSRPTVSAEHERYKREAEQKLLEDGGWRCDCGRVNANYVYSCACGKSKDEVNRRKASASDESKEAPAAEQHTVEAPKTEAAPKSQAAAIREYKTLLDDGIITQEEFEAKKKQLLGL